MLSVQELSTLTPRKNSVGTDAIGESLRSRVVLIAIHIAEHPIPDRFLGPLQAGVRDSSHRHFTKNGVVVVSALKKTWWDVLEARTQQPSNALTVNADSTFIENAVHGAALVLYGLQMHRGLSYLLKIDDLALCRALFRCSSAVVVSDDNEAASY